jgi:hypothetical protein
MNADEKRALDDISRTGYHVIWVPGDFTRPSFGYSIGVEKSLHRPELMVSGLPYDRVQDIVSRYVERIRQHVIFVPDGRYSGLIDGSDVVLKLVDPLNNDELFGWALWHSNGEPFRMLQAIYPDPSGAWPWDGHAPGHYRWEMMHVYSDDEKKNP